MIRRILIGAAALLALVALGGAALVRLSPMEAADWHVDPVATPRTGKPNDLRVGPGGDRPAVVAEGTPEALLTRLDAVAMAEPRVERLAGSASEGRITYVQRSALMGYPDAITVEAVPDGGNARLHVWSRSRYGQSDMGLNAARVDRWLGALGEG